MRVKDWAHSRHLAGVVAVNRMKLFMSARSFPPTAVAGCTGPQSTNAEEGRPVQSTSQDSDIIIANTSVPKGLIIIFELRPAVSMQSRSRKMVWERD